MTKIKATHVLRKLGNRFNRARTFAGNSRSKPVDQKIFGATNHIVWNISNF